MNARLSVFSKIRSQTRRENSILKLSSSCDSQVGTLPVSQVGDSSMSANNPSARSEQFEACRKAIRDSGLRATPARIATLMEIRAAGSPMTHADIAERLAATGYDKTTAFRNLNDLVTAGLLRRTELGDHVYRFEIVPPSGEAHPHFLCVDCGAVTCLDDLQFTAGSRRQSETVGEVTEILLRGHCNECR
jgi:Fur family ferric uptake transcriptional regulator